MIKKWDTVSKRKIDNFKIFDLHWIKRRHPDWNKESEFVLIDSPSWVNIIPLTHDNKVIFIQQYRHGINEITLEVPGGLVEKGEDPGAAGERECMEETGCSSPERAVFLGENHPNPAFLNNSCFSYAWFGCEKTAEQNLEGNEDINVIEIPLNEVKNYILSGKIKHSLVLTAFFFYFLKFEK